MRINNKNEKDAYLKKYSIHEWFSFDITPYTDLCSFEKGEYLCFEGNPACNLYFLVKGRTKAYTTHRNGHISLIEFNSPVSIIGEIELLGIRKTTIAVQALESCVCISIRIDKCKKQLLNDPCFLLHLNQYLGKRIIFNTTNFVANQSLPLEERLCSFILSAQVNGFFCEKLTETSEYLGVSYRSIQRVIAKFCNQKIRLRTKCGYLIKDSDYLKKHSQTPSVL